MENLIILGAGGYGRTAAETARAMGVFGRVAFLDDGCTERMSSARVRTIYALRGNSAGRIRLWRQRAARRLAGKTGRGGLQPAGAGASEGLCQPHGGYPSGAVVLALAAVGACAVVEQGAIVNMGAIADHDCVVGACAHLAPGAIVKAGNTVPAQMKIESGTVLERGAAFLPLGDSMSKLCLGRRRPWQMVGEVARRRRELGRRGVSGRRRPRRGRCRQMHGLHFAHG